MNNLISNEAKEYAKSLNKNIILVSLEGLYYYTNNSWNIVNNDKDIYTGDRDFYRSTLYGTGTGYNSENLTSCIGNNINPIYYNQDPSIGGSAVGQCNTNFLCSKDSCPNIDKTVEFSNCRWTSVCR